METADWAVAAFSNELTVVKADPRRRAKAVSLLTVCSGISFPPRVETLKRWCERYSSNSPGRRIRSQSTCLTTSRRASHQRS